MIVDLLFIVAAVAILIAIYKLKFSKENINREIQEATQKEQQKISEEGEKQNEETRTGLASGGSSRWSNEEEEESEEEEEVDMKKKLRKQQKQKEKQERKEAQESFLQQERQKREKYEKEMEQRDRLQQQKRQKEEQVIAQLRQDERKRKEEQFNKWKDMFKVEEEGKDKLSEDEQKRKIQAFNQQFTALLKKNKLLLLEDLSHKFKMSTKEIVEKIKQLQTQGLISGIFDERGKYLVIEPNQWEAIRSYISVRGRVKKTDIMKECARLIKIPDDVEEDLLNLIEEEEKA